MTSLNVKKGFLPSSIELPSSKSYANRALILGALKAELVTIQNLPTASDVFWLVKALRQLGLQIDQNQNDVNIKNSFPACEGPGAIIEVGEGGTTARFLAAMILKGKSPYTLILGERLKDRPWDELMDLTNKYGAKAELVGNRLFLQGPLKLPKELEVDCSRTTQFASGLLLSFNDQTEIRPVQLKSSQSYWLMTLKLIEEIAATSKWSVPYDWSSASYPIAYAAINQKIRFPGLQLDLLQADAKFYHLLEKFSAFENDGSGLSVKPITEHFSVKLDVSDCLDLVPALSFFLGHVEGSHELVGISNLIHKESDRLNEVIKLLKNFGKKSYTQDGALFIEGSKEIISENKKLVMPDDHRMVMTGALFLLHHAGGSIGPAQAVEKSYPDFFKLIEIS